MCGTCDRSGYAWLMSRHEIYDVIKDNKIAKYTWKGGHLYWPSEVYSRLGLGTQDEQ